MSRAVYMLSWSAASQTYGLSGLQSGEVLSIVPDSPAWFAWLAERSSFSFHGQQGSYIARLEAVQRGGRYWYAYQRTGQKLSKKYLGKTADLTQARLEQVASFRAFDDPERNRLVLFKLHPLPAGQARMINGDNLQEILPGDKIMIPIQ